MVAGLGEILPLALAYLETPFSVEARLLEGAVIILLDPIVVDYAKVDG